MPKPKSKPKLKPVCGIRDLKKGERRATMVECIKKRQVRYFGIKKIDKVLLDMARAKKKRPENMTTEELVGKSFGMKTRAANIKKEQEIAKKKGNDDEYDRLQVEYDKIKREFPYYAKLTNERVEAEAKANAKVEAKKKSKKSKK